MVPKFDPSTCPKPGPPPALSCVDVLGAHPCVCTTCNCGTHKCKPALVSKFQPVNISGKDIRMQGITEYNDKYYEMKSGTGRRMKDMTTLPGCYPQGQHYIHPLNTDYAGFFDKKPIFPAKLWNPKRSNKEGPTFYGDTVYKDCYNRWESEPRNAFKPPGFTPNKEEFDDRTTYTQHYKDRSRPEQPWRKAEHWPHKYSLCEVCHPTRSGPYKTKVEDVKVVNIKGADLDGRTTYNDFHYDMGISESARTVKPVRWGPKVEPLEGKSTYSYQFRRPPNKDQSLCSVMMRPMPTNSVSHHQCYP